MNRKLKRIAYSDTVKVTVDQFNAEFELFFCLSQKLCDADSLALCLYYFFKKNLMILNYTFSVQHNLNDCSMWTKFPKFAVLM